MTDRDSSFLHEWDLEAENERLKADKRTSIEINAKVTTRCQELEVENGRLKAALASAQASSDCIHSIRADLEKRFGPKVRAAFFDDLIANALVLARGEEEERAMRIARVLLAGPALDEFEGRLKGLY